VNFVPERMTVEELESGFRDLMRQDASAEDFERTPTPALLPGAAGRRAGQGGTGSSGVHSMMTDFLSP
jgi:hypothetical protein